MQSARRLSIAAVCTLGVLVSATAVQAQPNKLLPSDTEMVVTINLQQVLKSDALKGEIAKTLIDLVKAKINQGLEDQGLDKHLKKAGFDMFKDLSSLTFAVPGGRNPEEAFIIIEGNFDADKIEEAATEAAKQAGGGFKVTKIGNVKAFEVSPKDEKTMYVGVLNKKTMIACATKADFTEAVARLNGTKKATFKSDAISSLLKTVSAKQSISMIATSSVLTKLAENAPQGGGGDQAKKAAEVLKAMEGFTLAITVQKDIDIQAGANTKAAETAKEYAGLINLLINGAKAQVAEQAKNNDEQAKLASEILNTIRATTEDRNLMIRGQITLEQFEKLLKLLPIPNN